MTDQLISFKTAKLANDKMCNVECSIYIEPLGKVSNHVHAGYKQPTQSLLQKWLREKYKIDVEAYSNASGYHWILSKSFHKDWLSGGTHIAEDDLKGPNNGGGWDTYESALEVGLQNALKRIKPTEKIEKKTTENCIHFDLCQGRDKCCNHKIKALRCIGVDCGQYTNKN